MAALPIIVIGASEGGVTALRALHAALPADWPAAVFVVLHIGANDSVLPAILNGGGLLPVAHPKDGDPIAPGHVYVAPPDHHMILSDGAVRLTKGPRENFARPSIDPLFRSAAESYGSAVVGLILTGGLNDGTAGLYEVAARGGVTIVQEPDDATNPSMPRSALNHVAVDYCEPLALIPQLLQRLVAQSIATPPPNAGAGRESDMMAAYTLDQPIAVTCPDCGGALRQSQLGTLTQFRCHIGHTYTAEVMLAGQFRALEQSIEAAMRSLNERALLCGQMADRAEPDRDAVTLWRAAQTEAHEQAGPLRDLLERQWRHPAPPGIRVAAGPRV